MRKKLMAATAVVAAAFVAAVPGLAQSHDSNRDQLPDKWEKRFNLSLNVDQSGRDQDRDGLENRCEFEERDNPRDPDTDDDSVRDEMEIDERECEDRHHGRDRDDDHDNSGPGSQNSGPGSQHD